jgi:hypothetical protein
MSQATIYFGVPARNPDSVYEEIKTLGLEYLRIEPSQVALTIGRTSNSLVTPSTKNSSPPSSFVPKTIRESRLGFLLIIQLRTPHSLLSCACQLWSGRTVKNSHQTG